MPPHFRILLPAALFLHALPAAADDRDSRLAALFDRPVATQTVPAPAGDDSAGELRCTYFRDFLVREKGTDTPAPDAAEIVRLAAAPTRPACRTATGTTVPLKTENFSLLGRKGGYVLFQQTDPNGAVPFLVIDAATGRTIYTDGMIEERLHSVTLVHGVLHLRYTHGMNGACSLPAQGQACWDRMVTEGTVPPELARAPLPSQACTLSYRKAKAPADDPSIVSFELDLTLDPAGKTQVISRGKPGCAPMP